MNERGCDHPLHMTIEQMKPEVEKAKAKIKDYIKSKGWKASETDLYGIGVMDPRCNYAEVRIWVRTNGGGLWNKPATHIKINVEGPPRKQNYSAPSCAQMNWSTVFARIDRAVETATATTLRHDKARVEEKRLAAKADTESPIPPLSVDTSFGRTLQPEGAYAGGKYRVALNTYLDLDQLNQLTALLAEWKKP